MSLLSTQEELLESVLGCVPVGQIVSIKPLSEDFCYVLGYLLTWKLILTFFKAASSQVNDTGHLGVVGALWNKPSDNFGLLCSNLFLKGPSFLSF